MGQEPPKAPVYSEVIIHFKPRSQKERDRGAEGEVKTFRQASYQIQVTNQEPILLVLEDETKESHYFHWGDVDHLHTIPALVERPRLVQ